MSRILDAAEPAVALSARRHESERRRPAHRLGAAGPAGVGPARLRGLRARRLHAERRSSIARVRMIAEAAASVPLLLYEGAKRSSEHPLLDLLAHPNPRPDGADFLEAWYGLLLVAGNAYVEAVGLGGACASFTSCGPTACG